MSQITSRSSWLTVAVLALLAISTVNAAPVRGTTQEMEAKQPTKVESRSPVSRQRNNVFSLETLTKKNFSD
jgi:hypothetical protein